MANLKKVVEANLVSGRRRRSSDTDLKRAIELILKAHAKGELGEHIETLKTLAKQLPQVTQDENRWKKFAVGAKREVYEISATILAKLLKEFSGH